MLSAATFESAIRHVWAVTAVCPDNATASVYGASGSVGTASIQVARAFGATVTAICSSANFDLLKSLGADFVIDYRQEDFTENGSTYDIIFDTVGKLSFLRCKNSPTPTGIYLDSGGIETIFPMMWTSVFGGRKAVQRIRIDRESEASHDLIRLLDKPDDECNVCI